MPELPFPHILGADAAGEVAELGEGVTGFEIGERVIVSPGYPQKEEETNVRPTVTAPSFALPGLHISGTYTQFMEVPAYALIKDESLCLADELLARRSLEGLGNGWARTPEQRGKEFGEVDESLSCGADDAGEDLLGLRAAGRPIAATDFAIDDGRADGLLGTPVGRVHLGRPQEGEHGGEFAVEMGGEALGGRQGGRRVEEPPEAREQAPTGHGEAVIGERVCRPSVAEREGVGEDRLHAGRPRTVRMIRGQRACPS